MFDSELDPVSDALDALSEGVADPVYAGVCPQGPILDRIQPVIEDLPSSTCGEARVEAKMSIEGQVVPRPHLAWGKTMQPRPFESGPRLADRWQRLGRNRQLSWFMTSDAMSSRWSRSCRSST